MAKKKTTKKTEKEEECKEVKVEAVEHPKTKEYYKELTELFKSLEGKTEEEALKIHEKIQKWHEVND